MKSIYDLLIEWHESNPNFKFLRYKKSYSLNDIIFEVEAISKSLLFVSSQHIGIYVKSKLDFILLYLACINTNKIPVIFKTTWGADEIDSLINKYKINDIICDWDSKNIFKKDINLYFFEELVNSSRGCGTPVKSKGILNYESIIFTSGSTGFPKGVCLTRENFYCSALSWHKEINFNSDDRYSVCLPLHHIAGLSVLYRSIYHRFGIDLLDNYRELDSFEDSITSLVPSILSKLINESKYHKSLKSYKAIILGGEAVDEDLIKKCIELKLNIFISYGMTETCSGISGFWLNNHIEKYDSVGKPFSDVSLTINDENNILISSKMNMLGYYQAGKHAQSFISSDIGEIKGGFLYIKGRSDDLITLRGEKINLDYIKNTLVEHDFIHSVEVILKIDANNESVIEANIIISNNQLDEQIIKKWCEKKIGKYKTPKKINIIKDVT